jgi:hypothetical protein
LPVLSLYFTNPAEYAIGDCGGGIFHAGSGGPGLVTVDLSPLSEQANRLGMCLLKVEAMEKYPDNRDSGQFHSIPITGGLFIEMLRPGFQPVPAEPVVGWCYRIGRTTKGRTKIEKCN